MLFIHELNWGNNVVLIFSGLPFTAPAAAAAAAAPAAEKKAEKKEESDAGSDDDMGFGLFD